MADLGLSTILGIVGAGASAAGTLAAGSARKEAADFQAMQLDAQAAEEKAAASREAEQQKRETKFILSRQQAMAADSNLGSLDETVLDLAGDVAQQGEVNRGMIVYGGEQRARGRRAQAAATRLEGDAAKKGSYWAAAGTIADGIGSFAGDYMSSKPRRTNYSGRYSAGYA